MTAGRRIALAAALGAAFAASGCASLADRIVASFMLPPDPSGH